MRKNFLSRISNTVKEIFPKPTKKFANFKNLKTKNRPIVYKQQNFLKSVNGRKQTRKSNVKM